MLLFTRRDLGLFSTGAAAAGGLGGVSGVALEEGFESDVGVVVSVAFVRHDVLDRKRRNWGRGIDLVAVDVLDIIRAVEGARRQLRHIILEIRCGLGCLA